MNQNEINYAHLGPAPCRHWAVVGGLGIKNDIFLYYSHVLGRFASLNHNIYILVDPSPVDIDHAVHASEATIFT